MHCWEKAWPLRVYIVSETNHLRLSTGFVQSVSTLRGPPTPDTGFCSEFDHSSVGVETLVCKCNLNPLMPWLADRSLVQES
eukprot:scaffold393548_cov21-Prasinocladus_malaysianus.AAC.1